MAGDTSGLGSRTQKKASPTDFPGPDLDALWRDVRNTLGELRPHGTVEQMVA
ncbi:hypothetical protein [Rhodovastum atsumiense]|uniref:hypothetical protein n=1 Tax=Rhodovastum atsumiense TaxID=504468 RepID=UPI00139F29E1|nr:hypothetical protein [Rhodovastum atsumiense]